MAPDRAGSVQLFSNGSRTLALQPLDEVIKVHERNRCSSVGSPEASFHVICSNEQGALRVLTVKRDEIPRVEIGGGAFALDGDRVGAGSRDNEVDFMVTLVSPITRLGWCWKNYAPERSELRTGSSVQKLETPAHTRLPHTSRTEPTFPPRKPAGCRRVRASTSSLGTVTVSEVEQVALRVDGKSNPLEQAGISKECGVGPFG